ncbi:PAS domain-containing sensor histidine kinase [uncultured Pseudacidovorax sp.]|uniref:hybrid sensor histidine kinase/response regulator n=1 Tax=uncultured Pseudacidovorax sp. TaxID=679313 RepID=UPI0025DD9973|nr:PAS domain-containing sensor histidine kinase [uncultured Pseudacidovorax sp.]
MRAAPVPTHWPFVLGECAALARSLTPARCPLGPPDQWPPTLRMLIDMMLPSQAEIVLFWGPDYIAFYNDTYAPTIGNKHPAAFGRPAREHWSELWDDLQPLLDRVLHFGETVAAQDRPFRINRHGQMEEVFFDISYSPVREHDGRVCGVLCIVKETTARVNATRRLAASEAHLREMEEQWRLAQAAGGVGVFVLDIPADTITASPGFYRAFGLPAHAAPVPSAVVEALKVQGESDHMSDARNRSDGSALLDVEYRIRRAHDGRLRWIWRRAEIVRDATGAPLLMRGVVQDVTVRHLAQATLRESEERFRALAQAVPNQVWTAGSDGALDWVNQQVLDYTGAPPDELLGHRWLATLHPDDRPSMRAAWTQAATTLVPYSTELRLRRHDGSWRWQLVRAQPVQGGDGGIRWIGTTTDIQDQKAAQAQLEAMNSTLVQRVEERTRDRDRLWQLSTDVMVIADLSGRILHVNPAWSAVLGWSEEELLGGHLLDFTHPDDLAAAQHEIERLARGIPTLRFEGRMRHRDGSTRTLSWTAVPDAPYLHAVGRDVTALRESEARLRHSQKMEAIGQLTGGIAHDFNNMLQGITGAIEVMRRRVAKGQSEGLERFMDSATQSAQRAASLVQRLLAFSRRQSLDPKPLDVNRLVRSMEEMLHRTLGEHVRLDVGLDTQTCLAVGDESQLESAILNLAINARDAMPSGGQLRIATAHLALGDGEVEPLPRGRYVRITVADTGSGMPGDVLAKAFDPFFTTKPIGQGTGLGLSMVYGFAQQSGGQVRIDSVPGQGTRVDLYLPCATEPPAEAAPVGQDAGGMLATEGEVVLLVEDDPGVRLLVREVLIDLGYRTLEAADGPSALPILQSHGRIDLLVSDVGLPGLNGRQLAEIARQHRPGLRVLFMTGYAARAAVRSEFLAPGMDMIAKPFAVDELVQRIRAMVGRGSAEG